MIDKAMNGIDVFSKWAAAIAIFLAFIIIILPVLHRVFFEATP